MNIFSKKNLSEYVNCGKIIVSVITRLMVVIILLSIIVIVMLILVMFFFGLVRMVS